MNNLLSKLVAILLLTGTTTVVAQKNMETSTEVRIDITSGDTDQELKEKASVFKKDGIDIKFRNIKRNAADEIKGLKAVYETPNGKKGKYSVSGPFPIKPITFYVKYDDKNAISDLGFELSKNVEIIAYQPNNGVKKSLYIRANGNSQGVSKTQPLFVVDGKEMDNNYALQSIDPNTIKSVSVLKNSSATNRYGDKGENGVVEIITKKDNVLTLIGKEDPNSIKPLYVIDGKQMPHYYSPEGLKPDAIESMSVLKGKSATNIYGEKAKNGVIVIKLKK